MDNVFGFEECVAHLFEFEALLKEHGITISQKVLQARGPSDLGSSDLGDASYSLLEVLFVFRNEMAVGVPNDQRLARDLAGLADLMAKLLGIKRHPEFTKLVPHLHYLANCRLLLNQRSSILDQEANKIIELYWAALCLSIGGMDLELDQGGSESSPDVLVNLSGRRWAFECKTPQASTQESRGLALRSLLEKAVRQINGPPAEVGIPIINAKNLIDHERVWTAPGNSAVYEHALDAMEEAPLRMTVDMMAQVGREELCRLFSGGKSLPCFLFFLQSTTLVHLSQFAPPVATRLNDLLPQLLCEHKLAPEDESVFQALNDAVMRGFPLVSRDPEVMGGTAVFPATRVPVQTLLDYLAACETIDDFLEGFPSVKREQVIAFLEAATERLVATTP